VPPILRTQAAAYFLIPIACACWAGNHVAARMVAGHAPAASLGVVRWILVLLLTGALAFPRIVEDWPRLKAKAGVMTLLGLVGGTAFGTLQYVALQYTTALNMGVVGSIAPAFIVAASYLLFRDGLGPIQLCGVVISLTGVLAIVTQLYPERLLSLSFNTGDILILVNMAFWAVYCACLRLRPAVHPMSFLFAIAGIAALGNLPFAVVEYAMGLSLKPDLLTASAIVYAALFTSVLAYVVWNRGVDLIGAPRASAFLHTIPLFSAGLATSLLGEKLMLFHVVGFALILAGVSLAARPARSAPAPVLHRDGAA
jgi:drug/metabolite transporter (DMT)-like permease